MSFTSKEQALKTKAQREKERESVRQPEMKHLRRYVCSSSDIVVVVVPGFGSI